MREILIINLTRMGDLLQTTPLMAGLKKEFPGARITLVINSAFSEICRGIPLIDELIVFDMKDYRTRLLEKKYSIVDNYRYLEKLIDDINCREYDLAINVTHSAISAIMISFIRAGEVRGFTIDSQGHRLIKHPWMRYFFNVIPNRIYNPFHLVDMYVKIGGVRPEINRLIYNVPEEDEEKASLLLQKEGVSEEEMLIGMHLGASKGDKTWPVASYAGLADMITGDSGAKIVLFGSPGETALAREFEKAAGTKPLNFVGKTNLGELAALLKRCRLFISNDTGPLHIATSVGTKVIDISTANVHFMETGPYGEGHYVIQAELPCVPCGFDVQCRDMVCKSVIKPSDVFSVVKAAIDGSDASIRRLQELRNIQVYKSHPSKDGRLIYEPLIRTGLSRETFYRIIYGHVWDDDAGGSNGRTEAACENICGEMAAYGPFNDRYLTIHSLRRDTAVLEGILRAAREGAALTNSIAEEASLTEMNVGKIKEIWQRIETIEDDIECAGNSNPCFRPLTLIFRYAKEAMEGNDIGELADASRAIYSEMVKRTEIMLRLLMSVTASLEKKTDENGCEMTAGRKADDAFSPPVAGKVQ